MIPCTQIRDEIQNIYDNNFVQTSDELFLTANIIKSFNITKFYKESFEEVLQREDELGHIFLTNNSFDVLDDQYRPNAISNTINIETRLIIIEKQNILDNISLAQESLVRTILENAKNLISTYSVNFESVDVLDLGTLGGDNRYISTGIKIKITRGL